MNTTPRISKSPERQAQSLRYPLSLQNLGEKLPTPTLQQRLVRLRQAHAQVRVTLESFH